MQICKGFDLKKSELGNGLNNMKKRAHDIDAEIIIESMLNRGTHVTLKL